MVKCWPGKLKSFIYGMGGTDTTLIMKFKAHDEKESHWKSDLLKNHISIHHWDGISFTAQDLYIELVGQISLDYIKKLLPKFAATGGFLRAEGKTKNRVYVVIKGKEKPEEEYANLLNTTLENDPD